MLSVALYSCKKDDENSQIINKTSKGANPYSIVHNGLTREYDMYIPSGYNSSTALPVIFLFHGFGGNGSEFLNETNMKEVAESNDIIIISPQGSLLDGISHWNSCPIGGDNKSEADDLGFVEFLLENIKSEYAIDSERIYAVGYSNGGMMSYGLAHFKSNLFAAVGSVSGTMLECYGPPSHPTPIIHLHGTDDAVIPYEGNGDYLGVQDVLDYWINFNKTEENFQSSENNDIEKYTFLNGENNVTIEHYKYLNGDHVWFNSTFNGKNASNLIWQFFANYDINGRITD